MYICDISFLEVTILNKYSNKVSVSRNPLAFFCSIPSFDVHFWVTPLVVKILF